MYQRKILRYGLAASGLFAVFSAFLAFIQIHIKGPMGEKTIQASLVQICEGELGVQVSRAACLLLLILAAGKITGVLLYLVPTQQRRKKHIHILEIAIWMGILMVYLISLWIIWDASGEVAEFYGKSILSFLGPGYWIPTGCSLICILGSVLALCLIQKEEGRRGSLSVLSGRYKGARIALDSGKELVVGSDPAKASLLISEPSISACHCCIQYEYGDDCYYVADYSTYGVYRQNGTRLLKNIATPCPRGTKILLGKTKNLFLLE